MRYTVERHGARGWEYWMDSDDEFTAYRIARIIRTAGYPARHCLAYRRVHGTGRTPGRRVCDSRSHPHRWGSVPLA